MTIVPVLLVSCVAVPANHGREVRFDDGGLFEAKRRCLTRMWSIALFPSDRCRLLRLKDGGVHAARCGLLRRYWTVWARG